MSRRFLVFLHRLVVLAIALTAPLHAVATANGGLCTMLGHHGSRVPATSIHEHAAASVHAHAGGPVHGHPAATGGHHGGNMHAGSAHGSHCSSCASCCGTTAPPSPPPVVAPDPATKNRVPALSASVYYVVPHRPERPPIAF